MPIEPYREYTLPQLAELGNVKQSELERAIKRHELAAVKGPGGRGGKWRVLGQRYIDWQLARHRQAAQQPRQYTTVDEAEARIRELCRGGKDKVKP